MATYSKKKLLVAHPSQISYISEAICADFEKDGFEVFVDTLMSGGKDISVTKGNLFKAILGMKSALKITLTPQKEGVLFEANVGIYGQQAIPTVISMLFFWPVLITQIWGLVQQSSLDDRALAIAEQSIEGSASSEGEEGEKPKFCTNCGTKLESPSKFCPECGTKL